MVPGSIGQDVVDASIGKVNQIKLFADDLGFLFRLALVESNFGQNAHTFANNNSMKNTDQQNIWSIDEEKFDETQDIVKHPELFKIYYELADKYDIDWQSMDLDDMQKPMYAALAAKMFLNLTGQPIPETVEDQAQYWKQHYSTDATVDDVQQFVRDVYKIEDLFECTPHINLCYVLDGSNSIYPNDFEMAKEFLYKVTEKLSSQNGQFCLVVFSTTVETVFDFQESDKSKRLEKIKNLIHPRGMTNTRDGIQRTVDIMKASKTFPYKTMFVLTDGESNYPPGVQPAVGNAQTENIRSWVWGVGSGVKVTELIEIAYNLPENVKQLTKFSSMLSFLYDFKKAVCAEPLLLKIGDIFYDTSIKAEKRYYELDLPTTGNGISLSLQTTTGKLIGYYAYSTIHPSSAHLDGQFTDNINIPVHTNGKVYVAIEGQKTANAYSILATNA